MLSPQEQIVHELQRSQWLSRAEIAHNQQPLIERLVRHAASQTDFYAERLAPLFNGPDRAAAAVDLSRWSTIPILTRAEVMEHATELWARTGAPDSASYVVRRSSGTTSHPLAFRRSRLAVTVSNCQLNRIYELNDFDLSGRLAHITHDASGRSSYPAGLNGKGWNMSVPEAELATLEIRTPPADQLEWLERTRPDYVMTYPNNLLAVAEAALARGGTALRFKCFIATGEVLDSAARDSIVKAFGCGVIDIYGAREVGPVAFQCPDGEGYHLCAETVLCELLDEEGKPAEPGAYGRVVVTPLYEYAMPFIRYDLGDYAKLSDSGCACGRGLPSVDRIGGRSRHLFVMPDGSRRWPPIGPISKSLTRYLAYRQVQFVQSAVDLLEIKFVPEANAREPDAEAIEELMRKEFHCATGRAADTGRLHRTRLGHEDRAVHIAGRNVSARPVRLYVR